MKKMSAKYPGTCRCGGAITAGSPIAWAPGKKAAHWACAGAPAPMASTAGSAFEAARGIGSIEPEGAPGHGPGCYGECDGIYDCS